MNKIRVILKPYSAHNVLIIMCMAFAGCVNETRASLFEVQSLQSYKIQKLVEKKLGLSNCQTGLVIQNDLVSIPCHDKKLNSEKDYGLRLCLVDIRQEKVLHKSSGAGDSYYMKLTGLAIKVDKSQMLMLAETGAEFSYGVDAYMLTGREIIYMGNMDAVIDDGGDAGSIVPFLKVSKHKGTITFNFSRDVLRPDDKGNYNLYSRDKIKYLYSHNNFDLIERP